MHDMLKLNFIADKIKQLEKHSNPSEKHEQWINIFNMCDLPGSFCIALQYYLLWQSINYNWFIHSYYGDEKDFLDDDYNLMKHNKWNTYIGSDVGDITNDKTRTELIDFINEKKINILTCDVGADSKQTKYIDILTKWWLKILKNVDSDIIIFKMYNAWKKSYDDKINVLFQLYNKYNMWIYKWKHNLDWREFYIICVKRDKYDKPKKSLNDFQQAIESVCNYLYHIYRKYNKY